GYLAIKGYLEPLFVFSFHSPGASYLTGSSFPPSVVGFWVSLRLRDVGYQESDGVLHLGIGLSRCPLLSRTLISDQQKGTHRHQKLSSRSLDDRVAASGELHLLAKWNVDERVWIAGADAVFLQKSTLTHRFPHPGDTEAREIASATLFSLSVVGEHKVTFGALGATSALV
ncbi:hypothetical protein MUK42_34632, partial [Musa troglodytarum]